MNIFATVLALVAIISPAVADINYCDPSYCVNVTQHVACNHTGDFASTCPSDRLLINFNDKLKTAILDEINLMRDEMIADRHHACRLGTTKWDDELEKLAVLNVMGCSEEYDCAESKTYEDWFQFKFSMYMDDIDDQFYYIERAFNKSLTLKPNSSMEDMEDFVHMWHHESYKVGCAALKYTTEPGKPRTFMLTCNYGFKLNEDFTNMYFCEKPAMGCKTVKNESSQEFPHLCSSEEVYQYL